VIDSAFMVRSVLPDGNDGNLHYADNGTAAP
jgi:hypothetical protein